MSTVFTVGLTGGIGSGKTTVTELFAALGTGIVDTDEISRQLTASAQPAMVEIARRFGPESVAQDGSMNRAHVRNLVFADPLARKDLEAILHPLIRRESTKQIQESTAAYVILVVPLLFESGASRPDIDRILVVDCDPETQVSRVMARSRLSREQVLAIIASQVSRSGRLCGAQDIIVNDGDRDALRLKVASLHTRYLELAAHG